MQQGPTGQADSSSGESIILQYAVKLHAQTFSNISIHEYPYWFMVSNHKQHISTRLYNQYYNQTILPFIF
jgi:hypothetical protein